MAAKYMLALSKCRKNERNRILSPEKQYLITQRQLCLNLFPLDQCSTCGVVASQYFMEFHNAHGCDDEEAAIAYATEIDKQQHEVIVDFIPVIDNGLE